ncbi:hypothetical protein D3C86_2203060 [compost metagenome]
MGDIRVAEYRLDFLHVIANSRGAPHVRIAVLVTRVIDLQLFHQGRVQVFPVG